MKILNLKINNILQFKEVEKDLCKQVFSFIRGINRDEGAKSNGAGKSSIMDIISWIIFDETIRGINKDSMIRDGQKKGYAAVEFEHNGDNFLIKRYRGDKSSNKAIINTNDIDRTLKTVKLTNELIINLLGFDFQVFKNTVYFGQDTLNDFVLGTSSQRIDIFTVIVGNEINNLIEKNKKDKKHIDDCVEKIQVTLDLLKGQIKDIGVEELKEKHKSNKINLENKREKFEEMKKDFDQIKKFNTEKKEIVVKIKFLESNLKNNKIDKQNYLSEIDRLSKEIKDTGELNEDGIDKEIKESINNIDKEKIERENFVQKYYELDNKNKILLKQEQEYNHILRGTGICKYCFSDLDNSENKKDREKRVHNKLKEINTLMMENDNKRQSIKIEIKQKEVEIKFLNYKYQKLLSIKEQINFVKSKREKINYINLNLEKVENKIKDINGEIDVDKKEIEALNAKYNEYLNINIDELEDNINNTGYEIERYIRIMQDIKTKIQNYNELVIKFKTMRNENSDNLKRKKIIDFWNVNLPIVKMRLIDKVLPEFETKTQYYLKKFAPNISIRFDTAVDRKDNKGILNKFNIFVMNTGNGIEREFKSFSGGEKTKISLSIGFALNSLACDRSNQNLNMLWLDEQFQGLDEIGIRSLIEHLKEERALGKNIWAISHIDGIGNYFDDEIVVQRENNISKIL